LFIVYNYITKYGAINIKQKTYNLGITPYILVIGYCHLGHLHWGKIEAADPFETSVDLHQSTRRHLQGERKLTLTDVRTPDVTSSDMHNSDWRNSPPGSSGESESGVGY
jgi:hypothetical protein